MARTPPLARRGRVKHHGAGYFPNVGSSEEMGMELPWECGWRWGWKFDTGTGIGGEANKRLVTRITAGAVNPLLDFGGATEVGRAWGLGIESGLGPQSVLKSSTSAIYCAWLAIGKYIVSQ